MDEDELWRSPLPPGIVRKTVMGELWAALTEGRRKYFSLAACVTLVIILIAAITATTILVVLFTLPGPSPADKAQSYTRDVAGLVHDGSLSVDKALLLPANGPAEQDRSLVDEITRLLHPPPASDLTVRNTVIKYDASSLSTLISGRSALLGALDAAVNISIRPADVDGQTTFVTVAAALPPTWHLSSLPFLPPSLPLLAVSNVRAMLRLERTSATSPSASPAASPEASPSPSASTDLRPRAMQSHLQKYVGESGRGDGKEELPDDTVELTGILSTSSSEEAQSLIQLLTSLGQTTLNFTGRVGPTWAMLDLIDQPRDLASGVSIQRLALRLNSSSSSVGLYARFCVRGFPIRAYPLWIAQPIHPFCR